MRKLTVKSIAMCILVTLLLASVGCQGLYGPKTPKKKTALFNGSDLAGWMLHVDDPNIDVNKIWSVKDSVVRCEGKPNGYMRTKAVYANYKLHVEWRWPEQPTNSGVLLHSSGPEKVWPRCIEAQLKSGSAGDFVLINGTGLTVNGQNKQDTSKQYVSIPKKQPSSEKPAGQWNTYDIACDGDTITVMVNGVLQNEGTKATDAEGWICLQSEGSPIEFRNIYIEPLQ